MRLIRWISRREFQSASLSVWDEPFRRTKHKSRPPRSQNDCRRSQAKASLPIPRGNFRNQFAKTDRAGFDKAEPRIASHPHTRCGARSVPLELTPLKHGSTIKCGSPGALDSFTGAKNERYG
jgi:hypothetical protein